ncbi:IQANK1 [Bugula neritina]|uniref:IQANK1 n=1 Tax=Bugula neritina TaxID=10212 RepID=A0A7J7K2C5_BUGNE|nr:IQANK1 [Bugula neritina]
MPPKAKPTAVKKPTQKKPAAKAKAKESTAPAKDDDLKKSVKETTTPAEVTPTPLRVNLKQMDVVLFKDADNKLKDSGKWPLIIDTTTQASTYLIHQDVNYLNSLSSSNMASEAIRLGLLGALRYGKPLVIDMMGVDMFQTISDMMNEVLPGLMDKIMDKSILEEEE